MGGTTSGIQNRAIAGSSPLASAGAPPRVGGDAGAFATS